ncbi:hypothetical protein CERSUDRAFT_75127 [Gelatoporia subvermispora B]|uniref:Uncharacterized protein n=1 Tax=Ceriporiopsis subvermispora (strain B) TaxID=914234 RepID=M2QU02_CERS8|nr:hypothetical protein CERSUDRAFT_75127 [Gelatoporia subvermispora B]
MHPTEVQDFQYWAHKQLFPVNWRVTDEMQSELIETLQYLVTDSEISVSSISPWSFSTTREMLSVVEQLRPSTSTEYSTTIVARLMHTILELRVFVQPSHDFTM